MRYSLNELSKRTKISTRNIRFYIQKGLVDRPKGSGKGAYYTDTHLEQLDETQKWKDAGLSLERIREIIRGVVSGQPKPLPPLRPMGRDYAQVWHRFAVGDGVELHLHPRRSGIDRRQANELAKQLKRQIKDIKKPKS